MILSVLITHRIQESAMLVVTVFTQKIRIKIRQKKKKKHRARFGRVPNVNFLCVFRMLHPPGTQCISPTRKLPKLRPEFLLGFHYIGMID